MTSKWLILLNEFICKDEQFLLLYPFVEIYIMTLKFYFGSILNFNLHKRLQSTNILHEFEY